MPFKLFWFTRPIVGAKVVFRHDDIPTVIGEPDVHPSGRQGYSFAIPDGTPNAHGAQVTTSMPGKVNVVARGRVFLNDGTLDGFPWTSGQTADMTIDDVFLQDEKVCPPPCPPGQSCKLDEPPPPPNDPLSIIKDVYATGQFDLSTKDGCGKFTEACCTRLHETHSMQWGHIKKVGAQNQFNGHAVDAIMLLWRSVLHNVDAGIYDIIIESESPNAKPAFNYKGEPDASLWFYPAKPL